MSLYIVTSFELADKLRKDFFVVADYNQDHETRSSDVREFIGPKVGRVLLLDSDIEFSLIDDHEKA